ncbi:MAG: histidine phosphatase family protein, partial [Chloroflexi bacterium]|nr:histidine phosphatase family protein [Chloroflexota bacterium]
MAQRPGPDRRLETVHLVRHAHAGDSGAWDGPDELRPLTPKGRRQAERLGAVLLRIRVPPDRIITSPKARALQTAEILGQAIGVTPVIDERLADGCSLGRLDSILADAAARTPLLVGHDPEFSMLLSELIGSPAQEMRKGALATIGIRLPLRPATGLLRWLIPPELLERT